MSKVRLFEDKVKKMREFDQLFKALDWIYPSQSCFSQVIDNCYMLKDDYINYVAEEFKIDIDDLCWFIFESRYGDIPSERQNGEDVFMVNDVVSFYEAFSDEG